MTPAFGYQEEQRAAVGIAFPEDRRKSALAFDAPQEAGDLDMRWEAVAAQAASRSSAPISTAASASRLRAPRKRSSVARIAGDPADRGERLQMLRASIGRREQNEDQIHRTTVDRLVIDRLTKPREQGVDLVQAINLSMRYRDSLTKTGRSQLLAFIEAGQHRRPARRRSVARQGRQAASSAISCCRREGRS